MRLLKAYALTAIVGTQTAQGKILKIFKNFKGSVVSSNSKKKHIENFRAVESTQNIESKKMWTEN